MPDWSYHPVFKPLLFRLPVETGRDLLFGTLGHLGRLRFGLTMVELLGHMGPPDGLETKVMGLDLATPLGLGAGLDIEARALPALARFGFGFLELGPVGPCQPSETSGGAGRILRDAKGESLWYGDPPACADVAVLARHIREAGALPVRLGLRVCLRSLAREESCGEIANILKGLGDVAGRIDYLSFDLPEAFLTDDQLPEDWLALAKALVATAQREGHPMPTLLLLPSDCLPSQVTQLLGPALEAGVVGVVVGGGVSSPPPGQADGGESIDAAGQPGGRLIGRQSAEAVRSLVRRIREDFGAGVVIVAADGVHEPHQAVMLREAGADLVQLSSGLVFAGPGLPKRTNEALSWAATRQDGRPPQGAGGPRKPPVEAAVGTGWSATTALPSPDRIVGVQRFWSHWIWWALLGAGMIIGGALAALVAITRVVLPYDEALVGLTRDQLAAVNPRLLPFMAHDRVTLAGAMLSAGILYVALSWNGIRHGEHWAKRAYAWSAGLGFLSFFLFLIHGYFDPLHAVMAAVLFGFFVAGRGWPAQGSARVPAPDRQNDPAWRRAIWGQLLFVVIGIGLIGAGLVIALLGATQVFVPEDLVFLDQSAASLMAANAKLLPLIAHDRAGLGGALAAVGVGVLALALWGLRRGNRWVWWTVLLAGLPGFVAALGIHAAVGYTDLWHLAPAFAAVALFVVGLGLTWPYLHDRPAKDGGRVGGG